MLNPLLPPSSSFPPPPDDDGNPITAAGCLIFIQLVVCWLLMSVMTGCVIKHYPPPVRA